MVTEIWKGWEEFPRILSLPITSVVTPELPVCRNFLDLPQLFELAFNAYTKLLTLMPEVFLRSTKSAAG